MQLRRYLASLLATSLLSLSAWADEAASPLVRTVKQAAAELPAGGLVLAEIDGANVRHTVAGKFDESASATRPEQRIFEIGSITKVFTGLLLAQASLEGKLSLDDPIAKYLPADLPLDPSVAAITLAQLSSHTSGLPRLPDNLMPADPMDPYADYDEARLYAFLRSHKLEQPAPQPAEYSNLAVGLLGHLLGRVYGLSYEELVARKITGPLGLRDTTITLTPEQQARFVTPHSGSVAVKPWRLNALAGAGALRSTAADMAKFVQALADPRSPVAAAWQIAREPRAPFGQRGQAGLGALSFTRNGETILYHAGGTGGFRSHFELSVRTGRGVVLLMNNDAPEASVLVASALRPREPASLVVATAPVSLPTAQLTEFAGVYEIDGRARFTAVVDDAGQLRIRLTGQAFLPVTPAGDDRFAATAFGAEFQFHRNAQRVVESVTLHQNGREIPARRTADAPQMLFPSIGKLREYAGIFELTPAVVFEVTATPLALVVKITGQPAIPVHNTREDHFVYDVVEAALTFERDADGKVTALVLHQNGMNQRAPRRVAK